MEHVRSLLKTSIFSSFPAFVKSPLRVLGQDVFRCGAELHQQPAERQFLPAALASY